MPREAIEGFIAAFKTAYKPNSTIPTLWMVVTRGALFFCSTHKTRGIYVQASNAEIDSVKLNRGRYFGLRSLTVVFRDLGKEDLVVSMSTEVDFDEIESVLRSLKYQIL